MYPVEESDETTMMPAVALGVILWMTSKLLLIGVLVLMHWIRQRHGAAPAPLFQRRTPVSGGARSFEGIVGLSATYALCAAVFFAATVGQPVGTSLALKPREGSPAAKAGLVSGDRARSVQGVPVESFEEFRDAVERGPESVSIEVERQGRVVPLMILKLDNRIGVESMPTGTLGPVAALSAAVRAPAALLGQWMATKLRYVVGESAETISVTAVGMLAPGSGIGSTRALALLLSKDLILVALVYVVILVADARSRARYPSDQGAPPAGAGRAS